ncbi:MAG: tetratricopeptide (TPR) repeat protein [Halioglobus sp.]|jgi:tetratricopeptide (TPR) repeat protein
MKRYIQRTSILWLAIFTLVACGGGEGRQAEYLARAQEQLDAGNLDKARIDLKNALQINDKSAQARYLMAIVEEKEQNWRGMYGNLNAAVELDPSHVPARIKLAGMMLASNNLEASREQIQATYDIEPTNPEVLGLMGALFFREGDREQAEEYASQALKLDSGQESAIGVLVSIVGQENPEEALAIIERGGAANPESVPIRLIKLQVLEVLGRTDDVIAVYQELMAEFPEQHAYIAQLAQYYVSKFRVDDAEAMLRQTIAAQPESVELKLVLTRLLFASEGADAAIAELEKMVAAEPANFEIRDTLGKLVAQNLKDPARIEKLYEGALEYDIEGVDSQVARARLADLALSKGDTEAASLWLEKALEIEPDNPEALTLRARVYLADGDYKAAIPDLRVVLRSDPGSIPAMLLLADAQRKNGAVNLSQDNYRKVLELQPANSVALYQSAIILAGQQKYENAAVNLEKLLEQYPENLAAINLLTGVYTNLERWDDAVALTDRLSGNEATSSVADLMAAEVALRQGDPDKAINAATRALDQSAELYTAATLVMRAKASKGEIDEAITYGEGYRAEQGGNASVNTVLAQLYMAKQQTEKAIGALNDTIADSPESIQAYIMLSRIYSQSGELALKESLYERGIAANPSSVILKTELAVIYTQDGRLDEALVLLEEAYVLEENSQIVINNLSAVLIDHFPTEANLRRVQNMTRDFKESGQPALLDTLGWLQYKLGNIPQSISLLKSAQELGGQGPEYWYHLGMAYHQNGDLELAKELLGKALEVEGAKFYGRDEAEKAYKSL